MTLNPILKNIAEELFWLGWALILAWYSAATWPFTASLATWKYTLLYFPFAATLVFLVKELFFQYGRLMQMLILSISLALSLVSLFLLYLEGAKQFFREQIPPLSEALKANDLMNIWALSDQQPKIQTYFLIATPIFVILLLFSALRTGFLLPKNR